MRKTSGVAQRSPTGPTTAITPSGHRAIVLSKPGHYVFHLGRRVHPKEAVRCPNGSVGNIPAPNGSTSGMGGEVGGGTHLDITISTSGTGLVRVYCPSR
jgi:hypothetical protein